MTFVRLFVFLGSFVAIALFTALLGPYFVDWSVYRADFERESSRILGQKVTVKGDVDMHFFPFPSLIFNDLTVGEKEGDQALMRAKRFEMDLEITPFLSGEIFIYDMRVEEPMLNITLLEDGRLDWVLSNNRNLAGRPLVLDNISVKNGQITLIDLQNKRTKRIDNINASLSAPELKGPWHIDGAARYDNSLIQFEFNTGAINPDGHIRLRSRLSTDKFPLYLETEGDVKIINNKPSYKGSFLLQKLAKKNVLNTPAAQRSLLKVNIKGAFEINNERLDIPQYRMVSGKTSASYIIAPYIIAPYIIEGEVKIDTGHKPEFLIVARGRQLSVDKLVGKKKRSNNKVIRSGLNQFKAFLEQIPVPDIPGQLNLTLPAITYDNTIIHDVILRARPMGLGWDIEKLEAKLPGRTSVKAKGSLQLGDKPQFVGNVLIASMQPSGFSSWFVGYVDPAIRQLKTAGISADVLLSHDVQRFKNLEFILGTSIINGHIERQHIAGSKPSIMLNLNGDELDIDTFKAIAKLVNSGKKLDQDGGLYGHNIDAKLDVEQIKYANHHAENVKAAINWENEILTLDAAHIGNFANVGVKLSGRVSMVDAVPAGLLSFTLEADQAEALFSFVREISGRHPIVEHLKGNQKAFDKLDLSGEFSIGHDQIPQLELIGHIAESFVNLKASGQALLPQIFKKAASPLAVTINAKNPQSYTLFSQMGFKVLPLEFGDAGEIVMEFSRGFDEDFDVTAKLVSGTTNINLDGFIDLPAIQNQSDTRGIFTLDLVSENIGSLLLTFDQGLPRFGAGLGPEFGNEQALTFNSGMIIDETSVYLNDMTGWVEDNKFSGNITFDRNSENLDFTGDLSLDEINFEWFYELITGIGFFDLSEDSWSKNAFLPPHQSGLEAKVKIKAREMSLPDMAPLKNISTHVFIKPGEISFTDINGRWFGGSAEGKLSISNSAGEAFVSLRGHLNHADISQMSWRKDNIPRLVGLIDISGNLEGTGANLAEIVNTMNGGGFYNLSNVTINNFDPDILLKIFKNVDDDPVELTTDNITSIIDNLSSQGHYDIEQLRVPFILTGGVQRIANITINNRNYDISGAGKLDLFNKQLLASINVVYDAGLEAQSGANAEINFDFDGPLAAPDRFINTNALSNFLSIRAYEHERRRVELLQAGIIEKQYLRREISVVKERELRRKELARLKAENARKQAEEEEKRAEDAAKEAARSLENKAVDKIEQQQQETDNGKARDNVGTADWQQSVEDILAITPEKFTDPVTNPHDEIVIVPLDAPIDE